MNLLPESVLHSGPFLVLATFVATNTMMYAVLAIAKLAPKVYPADLFRRRDQRIDNRSIYPDPSSAKSARSAGPADPADEGWVDPATELRAS
jgi:hypothetical protein